MSRHRHEMHKRARGGGLSSKPEWEAGGGSNAAKEAEEKKRGGHVKHHGEGEHHKHRADKRKRGGHVKHHEHEERKHGGHVKKHHEEHEERKHGGGVHHDGAHSEMITSVKKHSMHHHHGRARGGRIGANLMPLSTAARVKHITPGEQPEEGVEDMAKSQATIKG